MPKNSFDSVMGEDAAELRDDLQAVAYFTALHAQYILAPEGSEEERFAEDAVAHLLDVMVTKPEKVQAMIGGLLALVVHLRMGNSYLAFFEGTGVNVVPITNTETGETC